uniref:Membrane-spanning 4-domains subfamily A member 4A-like n=1 Tax=Leptobrachium leishanense TaxID=445787 RepID=A0A8C5PFY8_9ANUR
MSSGTHEEGGKVVIVPNPQNVSADATQNHQTAGGRPDPIKVFHKGEPEVLGVTQILLGICQLIFGVILTLNHRRWLSSYALVNTGAPFWSGIMYIVSGSLSAASSQKPRLGMVRSTLIMNTISAVIASVLLVLNGFIFIMTLHFGGGYYKKRYCSYSGDNETCEGNFDDEVIMTGIVGLLFIFTLVELCVSISVSVFGCKTACRSSYNEMTVIIYQSNSLDAADPSSLNTSPAAVAPSNGDTSLAAVDLPDSIASACEETKTQ